MFPMKVAGPVVAEADTGSGIVAVTGSGPASRSGYLREPRRDPIVTDCRFMLSLPYSVAGPPSRDGGRAFPARPAPLFPPAVPPSEELPSTDPVPNQPTAPPGTHGMLRVHDEPG